MAIMGITIISPQFSFVQFDEIETISNCVWTQPLHEVLPIVEDSDYWFQFILQTDTKGEADALCADDGMIVRLGIANSCSDDNLLTFSEVPERYRIDDTHVLYNWVHGFPGFGAVIDDEECFLVKITVVSGYLNATFCSGLFKRSLDNCFTAVIDYGNDDNFANFNYCGGVSIDQQAQDCTPTEISFSNQTNIDIPYTAQLIAKYGNIPSVQVWIYDDSGNLVDMGIRVTLDGFPPSTINADFGGSASGILKIS